MGIYAAMAEAIRAYAGLPPDPAPALFTALALVVGAFLLVSGFFLRPRAGAQERSITLEPIHVGDVTLEELKGYDGSDPKKPLLMVIRGQVYDVSRGRPYYGPGGEYALFAGRDATRALALMSFDPDDLNGDLEGLGPDELEVLQDWEEKFKEKYVQVGRLVSKSTKDGESDRNKD